MQTAFSPSVLDTVMEYVGGWSIKVEKKDSRPLIYKKRDCGGGRSLIIKLNYVIMLCILRRNTRGTHTHDRNSAHGIPP